jgi:Ca2+-binding EF-hand superfamily protein
MQLKNNRHKLFAITLPTIMIFILILATLHYTTLGTFEAASPDPALIVTTKTDKQVYLLRQKVTIEGNITTDSIPATNLVVNVQINNPLGYPEVFRTLQIRTPTQAWPINITGLTLEDTGNNPINTARTGSTVVAGIYVQNPQLTSRLVYGTITVFDANMVSIGVHYFEETLDPGRTTTSRFSFQIPKWACSGKALIVGNAYSKEPKTGGLTLSLEKTMYYCISKIEQGLLEYPSLPPPPPQNTPGIYETYVTLSPDPAAGTYNVYVLAQASPIATCSTSTTFSVQNSAGYPPQASFIYPPAKYYQNMTVSLDASFSTPEGFNDKITKYEWTFGDGTPKVTKTGNPPASTITHNYILTGTFKITLNATDNEGLWSTTSKPITIYPEFGPTANFTWTPILPYDIDTVTFDASRSTTGWCAKTQSFSPIINYTWNFHDGTGNITTTSKTITHMFGKGGNYSVYLTVVDACGRSNQVSAIVEVLNSTGLKTYDINGDGKIDLKDVYLVAKAYGSFLNTTDGLYYHLPPRTCCPHIPNCDCNKDGKVDLKDYYPVCKNYGKDP